MMDRLERDWSAPPYDSLAEAIVLRGLLYLPSALYQYDVGPLLQFPEHRWCLEAMVAAEASTHGQSWGHFYVEWLRELERRHPGRGSALEALLDVSIGDDEFRWIMMQSEDAARDGVRYLTAHVHPWLWWLGRLQRVADARRLIQAGQEMAERGWRMDVEGARAAARRVGIDTEAEVGMDLPV